MKAVRLVVFLIFALLVSGRQILAQEEQADVSASEENSATENDQVPVQEDAAANELSDNESAATDQATENEIKAAADTVINEAGNAAPEPENEISTEEAPSENNGDTRAQTSQESDSTVSQQVPSQDTAAPMDEAIVDAVKAEITERSKASGKLDVFDSSTNKVRTLDMIGFKSGVKQAGDNEVVQADFRDTSSGDVVTMDITLSKDDSGYKVKDMTISGVAQAPKQEAKAEYSDEEILKFMKDYIDVQSQATGTFDLYDEKKQKMRNLQFVSLDPKLRRYGIIAISTADFTDKNTGDTVMVDVNAENRNGLGITAMRLKSVKKAPVAPAPEQQ